MKTNNSENKIKNIKKDIKNLNFPESLSSINLKSTSNLLKSLRTKRILPPISPKKKNIIENQSNSYLYNFITNISNNIQIETDKTILDSSKYIMKYKSKNNMKNYFSTNNINNHININNNNIDNFNNDNFKNKRKLNFPASFKTKTNSETKNLLSNCISSPFLTDIKLKPKELTTNEKENKIKNNINFENTLSSISVSKNISNEKINYLNKFYYRIRTYQPHINLNWKEKLNLKGFKNNNLYNNKLYESIEYQYKIINDNINLLFDNINYYKLKIIPHLNYINMFKSLSKKNQINYNKSLEECIGIFYLIPQLLLLEFYKFIEKFNNIHLPNKNKFKEKFIFNELECLFYNNKLLKETTDFFRSCFDVYSTLIKNVDKMELSLKNFCNLITLLEKGRFNISNIITISENGIERYENDLKVIKKVFKKDKDYFNIITKINNDSNNDIQSESFSDKLNNQFLFKKNKEKQRIFRIKNALKNKYDDDDNELNINNIKKVNFTNNNKNNENKNDIENNKFKFKSILNNKLITNLMKYCKKDVKEDIENRRIYNEMEENNIFNY